MRVLVVAAAILMGGAAAPAQPAEGGAPAGELLALARELRIAMYYSALAIYAPTPADRRLYAQQVVNLLEGVEGEHFTAGSESGPFPPGMLVRLRALEVSLLPEIPPGKRRAAVLILNNVRVFLEFALEETLAASRTDDMVVGAEHMRKAFAFLSAAWGAEVESPYLGGMWLLLRYLERSQRQMPMGRPHP